MLTTFIRSLPFLFPFLKEVITPDKEGKHHTCTRVVFILLSMAAFFYLIGKPMLNEWVEIESENRVLEMQIEDMRHRVKYAEDNEKNIRVLLQDSKAEYLHLRNAYDALFKDHSKLEEDHRALIGQHRELVGKVEMYQRGHVKSTNGAEFHPEDSTDKE